MDSYGKYKTVRNAAWQCLIDYRISSLPVNLPYIAKSSGIRVVKNSTVGMLTNNLSGKCIFNERTGKWNIVYNDKASRGHCRFTIAHELGHIFLGHKLLVYHRMSLREKTEEETAADMFAARLLMPACALWGLDLHTWEEIARVCDTSMTASKYRAERMELLYKRNKFLKSSMERQVYGQFKEFIEEVKRQKKISRPVRHH